MSIGLSQEHLPHYRGQVIFRYQREEIGGKQSSIPIGPGQFDPYSVLGRITGNAMFAHQAHMVESVRAERNVLLMSPFNAGKTTGGLLYALDRLFNNQQSVLFVSANAYEKKIQRDRLIQILQEVHYDWLVDIRDNIDALRSARTFPVLALMDIRELHAELLPTHETCQRFFETLGLVVVDDLECYSGAPASNLHHIVRRLRKVSQSYALAGAPLRFLVLSQPIQDSEAVIHRMFGDDFQIISTDDRPITSARLFYWVPAFASVDIREEDTSSGRSFTRSTRRESAAVDAYIIALESAKQGKKTVVYFAGLPLDARDIDRMRRDIGYSQRYEGLADTGLLYVGSHLGELTTRLAQDSLGWHDIDTIIVTGFFGPDSLLRDQVLHIGKKDAEIIVVIPQTPYYQYYINHPQLSVLKNTKEIVTGEPRLRYLFETSAGELEQKHEAMELCEAERLPDLMSAGLPIKSQKRIPVSDDHRQLRKKIVEVFHGHDINTTGFRDVFRLILHDGHLVGLADRESVPDRFFKGSVVTVEGRRYKVEAVNVEERSIRLTPVEEFAVTLPGRVLEKSHKGKRLGASFKYQDALSFQAIEDTFTAQLGRYGFVAGTDLELSEAKTVETEVVQIPDCLLSSVEVAGIHAGMGRGMGNLLVAALRTRYAYANGLEPRIHLEGDTLHIYNVSSSTSSPGYFLQDLVVKDLLEIAYRILEDCPCENGCPGCLSNAEYDASGKQGHFNKRELLSYLGELVRKEPADLANVVRWKFVSMGDDDAQRDTDTARLQELRDRALTILEKKGALRIEDVFPVKFMNSVEERQFAGALGIFSPLDRHVYIKPGLKEALALEVCAHEYIHNWQHEANLKTSIFASFNEKNVEDPTNIWFRGKMIVEGQANWGAAKVMDYYGLRDTVFSAEQKRLAQYSEGLKFVNDLERRLGLHKLIGMLRTATLEGKSVTANDCVLWATEFQIAAAIQGQADRLIDSGHMRCLWTDCLDKMKEMHRITFFLDQIIDAQPSGRNPYLWKLFASYTAEAEAQKIHATWKILKKAFQVPLLADSETMKRLACCTCAFRRSETLDGMCVMFGSISVKEEIVRAIKDVDEKDTQQSESNASSGAEKQNFPENGFAVSAAGVADEGQ